MGVRVGLGLGVRVAVGLAAVAATRVCSPVVGEQAVMSRERASRAAMRRRGGFGECIARIVYHEGGENQRVSDSRFSGSRISEYGESGESAFQ